MSEKNEVLTGINPDLVEEQQGIHVLRAMQLLKGKKVDVNANKPTQIADLDDIALEAIFDSITEKEFKIEKNDGSFLVMPELNLLGLIIAKKFWPTPELIEENEMVLPIFLLYSAFNQNKNLTKLSFDEFSNNAFEFVTEFKSTGSNIFALTQYALLVTKNFIGSKKGVGQQKSKK